MRRTTLAACGLGLASALAAGSSVLPAAGVCEGAGFRLELTRAPSAHQLSADGFTLTAVAAQAPARCPQDLAAPFGVLDSRDTAEFVRRMERADASADVAEPFGVVDAADLVAYSEAHAAGCD